MSTEVDVREPLIFFGIGPTSDDYLQSLSDEEFNKLFLKFDDFYDKAITDYNGFHKKPDNETKYPFIKENIDLKVHILIDQSMQFMIESFRRSTVKYGWKRRKNQYD